MKIAHVVLCRDKGRWVERAIRTVLNQTYSPMEMIFSCQESRDDTTEIVKRVCAEYNGPNKAIVIHCPRNEFRGYQGCIAHWNWLMSVVDADVIIDCSADDYNEPERVAKVVRAFEMFNPSYVNTRVQYEEPDGTPRFAAPNFPDCYTRFVATAETITHLIGSSGSTAFARDLWEKYGPLTPLDAPDIMLPVMATFERGLYYIHETLHHHVFHASPENSGIEGQMRAVQTEVERLRYEELNRFHNTHHWLAVYKRLRDHNLWGTRLTKESFEAMFAKVVGTAELWSDMRTELTLRRIEPMGMRV